MQTHGAAGGDGGRGLQIGSAHREPLSATAVSAMQPFPALLCILAALLPAAAAHLWAWMYALPQHPPDRAALGRSAGPGGNAEEVRASPGG